MWYGFELFIEAQTPNNYHQILLLRLTSRGISQGAASIASQHLGLQKSIVTLMV